MSDSAVADAASESGAVIIAASPGLPGAVVIGEHPGAGGPGAGGAVGQSTRCTAAIDGTGESAISGRPAVVWLTVRRFFCDHRRQHLHVRQQGRGQAHGVVYVAPAWPICWLDQKPVRAFGGAADHDHPATPGKSDQWPASREVTRTKPKPVNSLGPRSEAGSTVQRRAHPHQHRRNNR